MIVIFKYDYDIMLCRSVLIYILRIVIFWYKIVKFMLKKNWFVIDNLDVYFVRGNKFKDFKWLLKNCSCGY